ncbi:MAG: tetratricopeptide repeat protein [Planctomycetes bacterium]|nr:tetratricopeptide repeat protein [Planctomycetota bacterium]MCC7172962.1 tetratricopeptide repeat protein [Planctomycetota bacterium]
MIETSLRERVRVGAAVLLVGIGCAGCGAFGSLREHQEQLAAARAEIQANRLDVAVTHLERAIAANPGDARGHLLLADVQRRLKHDDEFDRNVRRALLVDPGSPDAVLANAGLLAESGDLPRALALLDGAADRHPNRPEIHWGRGLLLLRGGDPHSLLEAALQLVEYADATREGDLRIGGLLLVAIARQRIDPIDPQALTDFCDAAKIEPDVAMGAGEELAGAGADKDLLTLADRCASSSEPDANAALVSAYVTLRGGNADRAIAIADGVLSRLKTQGAMATSRIALDLDVLAARAHLELGQGGAAAARLAAQARARPDLDGLWRMYADAAFASRSADVMNQLKADLADAADQTKDPALLELFAQIARAVEQALHPR